MKPKTMIMNKKKIIREHEHLVKLLLETANKLKKEGIEQKGELKGYKK